MAQRVDTLLALRTHHDEPGLTKHPEVLGRAGLAELEMLHQLSSGPLTIAQQVENLSAVRLGQGSVGAHGVILPDGYASCKLLALFGEARRSGQQRPDPQAVQAMMIALLLRSTAVPPGLGNNAPVLFQYLVT